ncbi:MAG: hypothetical protein PHE25_00030 [Candidatus Gracilibacteria bacterium]|nr:hypothetical protein [Candidatus Gracilibacteria bacterium]
MKKNLLKIFLIFSLFTINIGLAGNINFSDASPATSKIKTVSISEKSGTIETQISNTTYNVFKTIKIVIGGLLVVYMVYAGASMALMGDDEKQVSTAKRSIWHAIVALLFINIPGTLYLAFSDKKTSDDVTSSLGDITTIYNRNILMNSDNFKTTFGSLITFLEIAIVILAVFMFILQGIRLMSSLDEKRVGEARNKILWSLAGLIFIGIMEVWRNMVFIGDFKGTGQDMFSKLVNLALFFAGPIAIFFLSMAGYYYITSGGEDDKIKKAKSIVFNTLLATLLLLGMYTFLLDLKTLTF